MDQESIIYGCIKSSPSLTASELFDQVTVNKKAILSLPLVDDWPFLTQEMFSVPRFQMQDMAGQTNVVHFGMSYKGVEYEWNQWVSKFEALLKVMYWQSAVVHLETEISGLHTFMWEAIDKNHTPGSDDFNIRCEWNHELGLVNNAS
jgi:hypothetical protein